MSRVENTAESVSVTGLLIELLPAWFGVPESNAGYIDSAMRLPGFVAKVGDDSVGILLYRRHFPESAEIHFMAVAPGWHRRGVGRALVTAAEADLRGDGCRLLQVKTLGPTHLDQGYADTRTFYRAAGFLPLEENTEVWPGTPCLVMVKALSP